MARIKKSFIYRPVAMFLLVCLVFLYSAPLTLVASAEESVNSDAPTVTPFPKSQLNAKSAYLLNPDTGEILYSYNENAPMTPASLTKIMTLLLTKEELKNKKIKLSDEVEISEESWKTQGSRMFLEIGMHYTVKELIKGVAIVSGNDAAVSLAEHISGTPEEFVKEMNKEAKKVGMANTTFETVNGLPGKGKKDVTTAKDLATLAKYYIDTYPEMLKIHSTKNYTTILKGGKKLEQENNNSLLGKYKGMDGLKTGMADYYNFIGTAKRGEIRLIVVTLGSSSSAKRMQTAEDLLDYGFSQYKTYTASKKGQIVDNLPVYKAEGIKELDVAVKHDVTYGINVRDAKRVKITNKIPDYLLGGTKKGETIGKQVVTLDGKKLAESDIVVTKDLNKTNWFISIFHEIALLFSTLLSKLGDIL
ncbi:hypothetical protein CN918_27210 [Priestia megaterium]|nr:hypothetical protein CN918_27210 [Priestia megaterium]